MSLNMYHPRHTCITLDCVTGNTSVPRVIQVFGSDISPYHPGNHVITDISTSLRCISMSNHV